MTKRIFFNLLLLGAIFYTPWWAVAVIAFVGAFLFPSYYEIIMAGVLVDLLYGIQGHMMRGVLGLVVAVALFVVARHFKQAVR
ncbi:MAG: hypothetical protein AAB497_02730 [Patescibacteria group bacterium]